jgi:hypothetical protein
MPQQQHRPCCICAEVWTPLHTIVSSSGNLSSCPGEFQTFLHHTLDTSRFLRWGYLVTFVSFPAGSNLPEDVAQSVRSMLHHVCKVCLQALKPEVPCVLQASQVEVHCSKHMLSTACLPMCNPQDSP